MKLFLCRYYALPKIPKKAFFAPSTAFANNPAAGAAGAGLASGAEKTVPFASINKVAFAASAFADSAADSASAFS